MTTRPRRLVALGVLAFVTAGVAATDAGAVPIDDKRKQAAAIEAEIAVNADRLAELNEQIKGVQLRLDEANQTIVDAQVRIDAAQAETDRLSHLVRQRAAAIYRSATKGTSGSLLELDVRALSSREKYAAAATERDSELLDELSAARDDLAARRRDAEEAKTSAESERARLDLARTEFEAANTERERLLGQVRGEIATLVRQEEARRREAEAPRGRGGQSFNPGELPPVSGRAGAAVAFARAQLGKPYCYGGAGPDCYDCSGLTMQAWAQAGVGMPHNDSAQMSRFPRVPMDQIQPGDLVWFPGHVALYVGGGAVIVAPRTGDVVKYQSVSLYRSAVRPG